MKFDVEAARAEGYTDAEIADHLAQTIGGGFDVAGARQEGYSDAELIDFITSKAQKEEDTKLAAEAPVTNSFVRGLLDPFDAAAQMLPRGLAAVTSVGGLYDNPLSKWFESEAARVDKIVQNTEAGYQANRRLQGEDSWDLGRLSGNILNPANIIPGAAGVKGAQALGAVTRGAMGGAVTKSLLTGAAGGSLQPVLNEGSFAQQKLEQTALGAATGGVFDLAARGLGKAAEAISRVTPKGREKALRQYLNEAAGEERDAVIAALQDAKELVTGSRPTVAEVLSDIPSAAQLMAIQKRLSGEANVGASFKVRLEANRQARETVIENIKKSDAERLAAEEARDGVFRNIGAKALDDANVARQTLNEVQAVVNKKFADVAKMSELEAPLPSGWTVTASGRVKPQEVAAAAQQRAKESLSEQLKRFQLDALEQNGYFPLMADDIIKPIDNMLKSTISDESRTVLQGLRQDILSRADKDGILNSNDLYENVRKVINQKIAAYLNVGDKAFQGGIPQTAAETGYNVKKMLDAALDKSSRGLWKKYLSQYQEHSKVLNRMAVGEALSKKLNTALDHEKATVFAQAVDDATKLIKSSTGLPRYSRLSDILTPQEVRSVQAVMADLARKAKAERLASGLRTESIDVTPELPNILSRPVAFTNTFLRLLTNGNTAKINEAAAPLFLDPKKMAAFMENVPQPNIVMKLLARVSPETQKAFKQALAIKPVEQAAGTTSNYQQPQ